MESATHMDRATLRSTLRTRERWGWVLYDWANSAFSLCVITVIGSAYFVGLFEAAAQEAGDLMLGPAPALRVGGVALTAEAAWSLLMGASAFIVAVSSPLLGSLADGMGAKRGFLRTYAIVGVLATLALWLSLPWWAVGLLILLANVGYEGGNVYYNAFLPDIAGMHEQEVLSSAAFAAGYLGGVVVLIASLVLFIPEQVTASFLLVGAWWGAFAALTLAWLQERPARRPGERAGEQIASAWREVVFTVRHVARYRQAAWFLLAFLLYNDGIATLIANATPFALQNIYLDEARTQPITLDWLIGAIIMIQFIAFPGALFCGWLATRYGEKRALYFTLAVFTGVVTYGQVIYHVVEFYVMAALIGVVLGGAQAISRSLFAKLVPPGRNAEFFAFFALSSKFSAVIGPLVYGGLLLLTGDTRLSIWSLTIFFLLGAAMLYRVNVAEGRAEAGRTY